MSNRLPRIGQTGSYEKTNPDYVDQHVARMTTEYLGLSGYWQRLYLDGLSRPDRAAVLAMARGRQRRGYGPRLA